MKARINEQLHQACQFVSEFVNHFVYQFVSELVNHFVYQFGQFGQNCSILFQIESNLYQFDQFA